jgi:uncharacterized protein (TIGR03118 family)
MSQMFRFALTRRAAALLLSILAAGSSSFAQHYTRTDLITDQSTVLPTDPNLVNAWGLSRSSRSPWWVSDNGMGVSSLYDGTGAIIALGPQGTVTIPTPDGTGTSAPTGTVYNYTTGFQVAKDAPAVFLFVTEDGTIAGWNPTVNLNTAVLKVKRPGQAVYKGCAIAQFDRQFFLYATNFVGGKVEVFNSTFAPIHLAATAFRDPGISSAYAPFNIQNVGGNLVVTFAKRQAGSEDEAHGPGLGFVDVFNSRGQLLQRLQHGPFLNAPWGITLAPSDFGVFSHRLLIGNFGDGTIHAFNLVTGKMVGTLLDATSGDALSIDGLWALGFGNNQTAGLATDLYFTAGPEDETHGLLGKITAVAAEQRGNTE